MRITLDACICHGRSGHGSWGDAVSSSSSSFCCGYKCGTKLLFQIMIIILVMLQGGGECPRKWGGHWKGLASG